VLARLAAGGVAGATALAGITVGLAAPAHAAPVPVTTTLTDPAGNTLDGYVSINRQQADGTYASVDSVYVADGMVSLPLEPGTYKLRFSDEDGLFVPEYYSDKATFETADPVVVSGPTALAPVSLAARPLLTGVVVSPTGRPVENASVTLYDAATNTARDYYSTNRAGAFAFGVEPGSYKVRVSASGFAAEFYNNKPTVETADPIAVGAGGASAGQIVLSEGSVVTGRVTSAAGAPLERARVTVWNAAGTSTEGSDLTDANGVYRVEGVEPSTVKVQFTDPLDEYLDEWHADKATAATADPVAVGVDATVTVDASLAPDPANVAPDPADVDLFGAVVDSAGRPVAGAVVAAYDTPTDGDRQQAEVQQTNRAGQYFFTGLDRSTENAYKVYAVDGYDVEEGAYARLPRWFGGAQSYAGAQVVGIPAAGVNISLPLTGGISGTVSSESGMSVRGVEVRFFDESGNPAATEYDTQAYAEEDGTYTDTRLTPGTYKVQFVDSYYDDSDPRAHAPEWYDDTTFAKAKVITVKSGETVTGINAALDEQLRALRKPEIRGKQYLGGKLRAYPGVWSVDTGTTYAYEWLVDGAVVGTGPTYAVTKGDKNERVTLRVLSQNRGLSGTALTSSQAIKKKPKVKVSVKGAKASVTVSAKKVKAKKFKGSVVAKKIVRTDEYGAPVYKKIGKAKLRNGRASLTLKKLAKGKNKVVFLITLKGGKYGDAEVTKTIKVKR
jgi:protocatechuate 3,4-dioxygenase beta subunit